MVRGLALLALLGACDARLGQTSNDTTHPDATTDGAGGGGGSDAGSAGTDAGFGPWSTPTPIPGASTTTSNEDDCTLSSDTLDLIYSVATAAGIKDLYEMQRASTTSAWGAPVKLTTLDTAMGSEESPRLSLDDKTLYFGRDGDIYQSTRTAIGGAFSAPTPVTAVNTTAYEKWLAVCQGGIAMVSRDNGANGQDLFEGTLADGAMTPVTELNSTFSEISTFLSTDCLTVYFASNRSGSTQIYTATRATPTGTFGTATLAPSPFSPADGTDNEDAWISIDTRTFVFAGIRGAATTKDLYISTR
jgi:Tol biopolymer transport system component